MSAAMPTKRSSRVKELLASTVWRRSASPATPISSASRASPSSARRSRSPASSASPTSRPAPAATTPPPAAVSTSSARVPGAHPPAGRRGGAGRHRHLPRDPRRSARDRRDLEGADRGHRQANIGINYDPGNVIFYGGVRPEDDIPARPTTSRHMHVKDQIGGIGVWNFPQVGTGEVDFPPSSPSSTRPASTAPARSKSSSRANPGLRWPTSTAPWRSRFASSGSSCRNSGETARVARYGSGWQVRLLTGDPATLTADSR